MTAGRNRSNRPVMYPANTGPGVGANAPGRQVAIAHQDDVLPRDRAVDVGGVEPSLAPAAWFQVEVTNAGDHRRPFVRISVWTSARPPKSRR
jgi:hypothetical protein